MATVLENLTTARDNYASQLASISAKPKPNYSLDGQSVSWAEYQAFLMDKIEKLNELIQQEGGPFELQTRALT